jgi:hypothetical protein
MKTRISRRAEYALRALLLIAQDTEEKIHQPQNLSDRGNTPVKFLEQILLTLRNEGLLIINGVSVGLFATKAAFGDIGPRYHRNYWMDPLLLYRACLINVGNLADVSIQSVARCDH